MSDLHELCKLSTRPITADEYVTKLTSYLKSGIPSTYTIEEALSFAKELQTDSHVELQLNDQDSLAHETTTTPLHLICTHLPQDISDLEVNAVSSMVQLLLEYGAGWCLTDVNGDTPGCILIKRGFHSCPIYRQIVDAGVRAELLLRKVSEYDMEVIEDEDQLHALRSAQLSTDTFPTDETDPSSSGEIATLAKDVPANASNKSITSSHTANEHASPSNTINEHEAPSCNQQTYLATKLEYRDDALITKDRKDGVMMSWETQLMRLGRDSLFAGSDGNDTNKTILNIGFGMGIIDTLIQEKKPHKHYICEAHPDVLQKMRDEGWFDRDNVVVLQGRWQDELDRLLSQGSVFFDGIYYDTFLEHYLDMLDLFNYIVGLLKPHGIFSFFNGLGADRQVVYEVYKQLVEIDLNNYGLKCSFDAIEISHSTLQSADSDAPKSVWDDINRAYWKCPVYYHPEARFLE